MPLWLWVALGVGTGWLFLSGGSRSSRAASTSQGDVSSRTDADFRKLWDVCNALGADPRVLGLLLFEESGLDPGAKNTNGYPNDPSKWCLGLNQFCPGTFEYFVSVSPEEYLKWSMEQQLGPIGKYWASKPRSGLANARDIFWLSLWPVTWPGPGADRSAVVVSDPAVVHANQNIAPGSSVITAGDIDDYLASVAQSPGWQLALQRIAATDPNAVA